MIIEMTSKQVVISLCNSNGNYRIAMERLRQSAERFGVDFIGFDGEESVGAPPHHENPYAFKVYCWLKAIEMGYEQILWLDSSCVVVRDLKPVFDEISVNGYIMQEAGHMVGNWCNDYTLDYFGLSREDAMLMPMYGNAGFLGLDITQQPAIDFFHRWWDSMLGGCFKGGWENHRHDMVCGSIIANKLGMEFKKGDEWLQYSSPNAELINETIIITAQGM